MQKLILIASFSLALQLYSDPEVQLEQKTAYTLAQYYKLALSNNGELKAKYYESKAAEERISPSSTLPEPKLSYGHFMKSVETRVGPQNKKIGIMQGIPWPGKLLMKKAVAKKQYTITQQKYLIEQIKLFTKLKTLLLDHSFLQKRAQYQKEHIFLLKMIEQVAQEKLRLGSSSADLLQVQVEITSLENELAHTNERIKNSKNRVNSFLGRDFDNEITIPIDLYRDNYELTALSNSELRELNPKLHLLSSIVEKSKAEKSLATQSRFPNLSLGLDWIRTGRSSMNVSENGKDPVVAMITIDLPLWQRSYSKKISSMVYQVAAKKDQYRQAVLSIQAELEDTTLKFEDAKRRVELFEYSLIPQTELAIGVVQESYEAGAVSFEKFIDLQRKVLSFYLSLERAKVDMETQATVYDSLIGVLPNIQE